MLSKLEDYYTNLIKFCKKDKAKIFLYLVSFLESIILPFPTDPFLIPFIIAEKKFIGIAIKVTIFSVLGGAFSYFIGIYVWDIITPFLRLNYPEVIIMVSEFEQNYLEFGIVLIVIGGFSPFPYKITCVASGILGINFILFIIFSTISRGLRFLLISYIIFKYGNRSIELIKKNILHITYIILIICLIIIYK